MIRHKEQSPKDREQGLVSLLTVMLFMVFATLISVGYLGLVVNDQRRTVDTDLSSSALAAAHSGIEDGKRIIVYCAINPSAAGCDQALNSQDNCDAFKSGTNAYTLATSMGVPMEANGRGRVGGAAAASYLQYFTCLTIQSKTPFADGTVTSSKDYIQPLKTVSPFTQLRVEWYNDGSGYVANSGSFTSWPTLTQWSSSKYMPGIALQIIPYPAGTITNLDTIEHDSKTIYIMPCSTLSTDVACSNPLRDINILDVRAGAGDARLTGTAGIPVTYAKCSTGAEYRCSITLNGFNGGGAGQRYYVRAMIQYGLSTNIRLAALNSSGTTVNFDGVQPWIDATGHTNDVFRRIRAQVRFTSAEDLPQNVIDSAAQICKKMRVTPSVSTTTYDCPE